MRYASKGKKAIFFLGGLICLLFGYKWINWQNKIDLGTKRLWEAEALFYKTRIEKGKEEKEKLFRSAYSAFLEAERADCNFEPFSILHYAISSFYSNQLNKAKELIFYLKDRMQNYPKDISLYKNKNLIIPLLFYMGYFHMKDKDYSAALEIYKKLNFYLPHNPQIWYTLAWLYIYFKDDYKKAYPFILRLINNKIKKELKLKTITLVNNGIYRKLEE
jgi:tetratricopeptide (TPR) repeat protein